ncbi:MAG: hypothetical protein ACYTGM_06460 [Planctomycetota bacterium]|jgi:hypothetical protein
MTTDPNILLRQLEPVVRPAYAGAPSTRPPAPLEHQPFDELLAKAAKGLIASGRTVSAEFTAHESLTGEQLARLAAAADVAEAAGAARALLLMDGRGLVLDVPARTLAAELSADAASPVTGLDAAVFVAGDGAASTAVPLNPPGGVAPPAVGEQLDAARQASQAAA